MAPAPSRPLPVVAVATPRSGAAPAGPRPSMRRRPQVYAPSGLMMPLSGFVTEGAQVGEVDGLWDSIKGAVYNVADTIGRQFDPTNPKAAFGGAVSAALNAVGINADAQKQAMSAWDQVRDTVVKPAMTGQPATPPKTQPTRPPNYVTPAGQYGYGAFPPPSKPMSTGVKVGIAAGAAAVVGGIIFAATRSGSGSR